MKKIILIWGFVLLISSPIFAQKFQDVVAAETDEQLDDICKEALGLLSTPREIDQAINEIVKTAGLNKTVFKLRECSNIENAIAKMITENGKEERYIIYDAGFIQDLINETSSEWTGKFILAHEIGHHLYGHSLNNGTSNHEYELDADYFAGRSLSILGASLEQTLAATSILPERASSSHPARVDRIEKAKEGWNSNTNKVLTIKVKKEDIDEIAKTIVGEAKEELKLSNLNDQDYTRILQGLTIARTKYYNGYTEDIRYLEAICYTGMKKEEDAMRSYINYLSIDGLNKSDRIKQISNLFVSSTSKKSSYFTNPDVLYHLTKSYYSKNSYDKVIDYGKQFTPYSNDPNKTSEINKLIGVSEYKRIGMVKTLSITESVEKGSIYINNQEYDKAFEILIDAANKNNAKAQYLIGDLYFNGWGVELDANKAAGYYLKSAQQGNEDAQYKVGTMYYNNKSYEDAIFWLTKAADSNHPEKTKIQGLIGNAEYNKIAQIKKETKPIERKKTNAEIIAKNAVSADTYFEQEMYSDAFDLYLPLANKGDSKAQFRVGWMYYKGKGVAKKDKATAIDWWKIAARKGDINSINYLTRLGKW